jgi:hypothetical protein
MECNSVTLIHIKIEKISSREMGIFREYVYHSFRKLLQLILKSMHFMFSETSDVYYVSTKCDKKIP